VTALASTTEAAQAMAMNRTRTGETSETRFRNLMSDDSQFVGPVNGRHARVGGFAVLVIDEQFEEIRDRCRGPSPPQPRRRRG